MTPPYYVAVYGGFLVAESFYVAGRDEEVTRMYTVTDVRQADTWDTFEQADTIAKIAVEHLYPPDLRYFAVLVVPRGPAALHQEISHD
jgi:hypothetical protein